MSGSPRCASVGAVVELDQRVDDRLRVDDDVDPLVGDAEQVMGLDHLEALVHQRRRVDRDPPAHRPRSDGRAPRPRSPRRGRCGRGTARRRRSARAARPCPAPRPRSSWKSAECSESTGMIRAPVASASAVTSSPPTTRLSLLASARSMPSLSATIVGPSPAVPTIAFRTRSGAGRVDQLADALARRRARGRRRAPRAAARRPRDRRARPRRRPSSRACASSRSQLRVGRQPARPRARPSAATTSSACSPIEPVEPRIRTASPSRRRVAPPSAP